MTDGIQDFNETFVRVIVVAKLSLFLGGGGTLKFRLLIEERSH